MTASESVPCPKCHGLTWKFDRDPATGLHEYRCNSLPHAPILSSLTKANYGKQMPHIYLAEMRLEYGACSGICQTAIACGITATTPKPTRNVQ
ncbi:MAG: hypothetical protein ACUVWX_13520 [Kiritimatiellia bacterium]